MWAWDHTVATSATEKQKILDFASQHQVNRIYLEAQTLLSTKSNQAALTQFLVDAHAKGIGVELLFGDSSWALTPNHAIALDLAQQAVAYTTSLKSVRPVGVHFDVEPHTLPAWHTDTTNIANQFLDLLEELKTEVDGSPLTLSLDFHFSFGHITIKRGKTTRRLSQWIQGFLDRSAVMSYRDVATGSNSVASLSATVVADAVAAGKPIIVGVNTSCGRTAGTSFCDVGETVMDAELPKLVKYFASTTPLSGTAVHDYAAWSVLKP